MAERRSATWRRAFGDSTATSARVGSSTRCSQYCIPQLIREAWRWRKLPHELIRAARGPVANESRFGDVPQCDAERTTERGVCIALKKKRKERPYIARHMYLGCVGPDETSDGENECE